MKKILQALTILTILSLSSIAYAAPEQMSIDDNGTATGLIILNNSAEGSNVSTFENGYVLSGSGKQGVLATLYIYKESNNMYNKIYIIEDGTTKPVEWVIGPSGWFMQEVNLNQGKNSIAIRAEIDSNNYEVIRLDITLLNKDFKTRLKELSINIKDLINNIGVGD